MADEERQAADASRPCRVPWPCAWDCDIHRRSEHEMIQKRSIWQLLGLWAGTLGLYGSVWFYRSSREMLEHEGLDPQNAGTWTLLLPLPLINIRAYWRYSRLFEQVTGGRYRAPLMMALWMFTSPLGVIMSPVASMLTQHELNRIAGRATESPPAGAQE